MVDGLLIPVNLPQPGRVKKKRESDGTGPPNVHAKLFFGTKLQEKKGLKWSGGMEAGLNAPFIFSIQTGVKG